MSWVHVNALLLYILCVFGSSHYIGAPRVILSFFFKESSQHFLSWLFYCACGFAFCEARLLPASPVDKKHLRHCFPWTYFSFGKKWSSVCRHVCICVKQFPNPRNVVLIKHLFFVKNIASLQTCFAEYKQESSFSNHCLGSRLTECHRCMMLNASSICLAEYICCSEVVILATHCEKLMV